MSDEFKNVGQLQDEIKIDIPIEEDEMPPKNETPGADIGAELRDLGRQFGDTVRSAWQSEERQRMESEIREGVQIFITEVDKAIREVRESPTAQRVREESSQMKNRAETDEVGKRAKRGLAQGLQWMSEELGKLAQQFTSPQKEPGDDES